MMEQSEEAAAVAEIEAAARPMEQFGVRPPASVTQGAVALSFQKKKEHRIC
jgi:hypothetical protein